MPPYLLLIGSISVESLSLVMACTAESVVSWDRPGKITQ
jgi:hypothetical protein